MDLAELWPLPVGGTLRDLLLTAYADPSRRYHGMRHLAEVCTHVEEIGRDGRLSFDRVAVLFAAWFHDAVYDGAAGAEERSAAWAEHSLAALGISPLVVDEVARLVRLTETHLPADDDANGCVLSDADLAILGAAPARYAEYATAVRAEYAHVPDADFRAGRAGILRGLVAKPHLFHTAYAREQWEAPARANVAAELAALVDAGPTT